MKIASSIVVASMSSWKMEAAAGLISHQALCQVSFGSWYFTPELRRHQELLLFSGVIPNKMTGMRWDAVKAPWRAKPATVTSHLTCLLLNHQSRFLFVHRHNWLVRSDWAAAHGCLSMVGGSWNDDRINPARWHVSITLHHLERGQSRAFASHPPAIINLMRHLPSPHNICITSLCSFPLFLALWHSLFISLSLSHPLHPPPAISQHCVAEINDGTN